MYRFNVMRQTSEMRCIIICHPTRYPSPILRKFNLTLCQNDLGQNVVYPEFKLNSRICDVSAVKVRCTI